MSLKRIKIEKGWGRAKAGVHSSMKKERNRKIRRTPIGKPVQTKKYDGWEY